MLRLTLAAIAAFSLGALTCSEMPKSVVQIVDAEDGRKTVTLQQGDVLLIMLPNSSANSAEDISTDLGKTPLKPTHL